MNIKTKNMYHSLISKFEMPKVLVIGDLITDTYLKGNSTRLSPEGPVPVVELFSATTCPGGAANTAANFRTLGASVTLCSVTGADEEGSKAIKMLEGKGIRTSILQDTNRKTIVKTRVIADHQILLRYDSGTETTLDTGTEDKLIEMISKEYEGYDAIVLADYNKGVLTPRVIKAIAEIQAASQLFLAVDSKRLQAFKCLKPMLVKPNYQETLQLLKEPVQHMDRISHLQQCGERLYAATGATITAVTLDEDGAVLFRGSEMICTTKAEKVLHPNVAGAGDVYISVFTLACLAGADIPEAADLAGAAATISVSKPDTAICSQNELRAYYSSSSKLIVDTKDIRALCEHYRSQGKKVVFTNGCFDILHSGHVSYLNKARELGDVLIVGINNDESISRMKGSHRPINTLDERILVLAGLEAVTHIIPFGNAADDTPCELINLVVPDFFAKGGDYEKKDLPEAPLVEKLGGKVNIIPLVPGKSTTSLIRQINTSPRLKTV
jgi:D-beta-D-heptose 7-phosphate kinase/D-beta-D-heptose 1-phosphate adenosyltransferase